MEDFSWLSRTELLIGKENLIRLSKAHVLVIGLGGVGSFAAEFICRNGIGTMTIVDGDTIDPTNRNRQLPALATNHGESKADIMAQRLKAINPELTLHVIKTFINPDAVAQILSAHLYDYIIDAIDSVTPKITFLKEAYHRNMRIVSSMGAGGRMDPTMLKVVDISKTYNCNFAQQIRKNLKKEGISKGIKAVFSTEEQLKESLVLTDGTNYKKSAYGTMSYLPAVFGATCASVVIRDLIGENQVEE